MNDLQKRAIRAAIEEIDAGRKATYIFNLPKRVQAHFDGDKNAFVRKEFLDAINAAQSKLTQAEYWLDAILRNS